MTEKTITLDNLSEGQIATITKIGGEGSVRRRLMDMGLTRGEKIEMVRPSPLGDPIEYKVRGYLLSLRKSEGRTIEVEL